jgi:L-aspartate oxidase
MSEPRESIADVIVVGSGLAGMSAALRMAEIDPSAAIRIVTKTPGLPGGSSHYAQGGMAAALGPDDTPAAHARDTLDAAAGLGDLGAARRLTAAAPGQVRRLLRLGTRFDRTPHGELALGREAAHGRPRILHANGDATGAEIVRALVATVAAHPAIAVHVDTFAHDLIVEDGRVAGIEVLTPEGEIHEWPARHVFMATGGLGQLYTRTTNPVESTADGLAMAARAGACLVDLEFVQFHPTALDVPDADPLPLITEALRGAGAVLVDGDGRRFMPELHPDAELAPRDVVARAIAAEIDAGRGAFLDARGAVGEAFPERFPTVFRFCKDHGIDPRRQPIPVTPATHYHMGGIAVDADGRSTLPGLWAGGEVSSTGIHGANRLASNSLLEALVWGSRVAEAIAVGGAWPEHGGIQEREALTGARAETSFAAGASSMAPYVLPSTNGSASGPVMPSDTKALPVDPWDSAAVPADPAARRKAVRALAWRALGLTRSGETLADAMSSFEQWAEAAFAAEADPWAAAEVANLALVGRLVAAAALQRTESRGAHRRSDHPWPDPRWRRRILVHLSDGALRIETGEALEALERATHSASLASHAAAD